MTAVSARAREVLHVIIDWMAHSDASPTRYQLGMMLGITKARAQQHVDALVEAGFLRRTPHRSRSLEVVRLPGHGLTAAEFYWCQANPGRVRAMMAIAGATGGASAAAPEVRPC